ncbi:ENTH-domain-containing protein [Schizophyllum commune H4-8]|uniref:ENTH-domain-containing protein n=1 Tax=Schizophyllum commune (strain H4-8 / FGSC 9210) TaxID=578458 RepID=UPI00215E03EB|nr:ENTH-domain-containing protein [Schizophyllum commune H4-8]KAI5896231.1 ENTH-domain-containing protein [Schizophyllum commune H4-8]
MDKLESLSNQLSQITMYDIKSMYNQAKNIVLNVSEVEALVAEATNDEPWGASSTLMQNIANKTFNYPEFNEIMPAIYSRFMEKEARQWRQIYKALQLLEYLVKNGSERVVDDARSHLSTIKMLRSFHYIDDKGKDQGLNVRNRSRELAELLSDVEKIRSERRKAKANKNKYIGTGNDGLSFSSGGSRYGGFGSDSLGGGGYSGSSFSGGYSGSAGYSGSGGFASSSSGFRDDTSRRGFEEYDAGADEESSRPARSSSVRSAATSSRSAAQERRQTAPPAPKQPEPVVDLLGGFDDEPTPAPAPANNQNKALPALGGGDDDDFADFQAAPTTPAPAPAAAAAKPNLMDLLNSTPSTASAPVSAAPMASPPAYGQQTFGAYGMGMGQPGMGMGYGQPQQAAMGMGMGMQPQAMGHQPMGSMSGGMGMGMGGRPASIATSPMQPAMAASPPPMRPVSTSTSSSSAATPKSASAFDDLWSMSLGGSGSKPSTPVAGAGKSIKDLQKDKVNQSLWGAGGGTGMGGAMGAPKPAASNSGSFGGGNDDLLL